MQRPHALDPLFLSVKSLPGVGPRMEKLFQGLCGLRVADLLFHAPSGLIDRRNAPDLRDVQHGQIATVTVRITRHVPPASRHKPYRIEAADETGAIDFVFFHARPEYLHKLMPEGADRVVSGRVEFFNGHPQMPHPDIIVPLDQRDEAQTVEPVYPLTAGLTNKTVSKAVQAALEKLPTLAEWIDPALVKREAWPAFADALRTIHHPQDEYGLAPLNPARRRLAYDELLAGQVVMALVRTFQHKSGGRSFPDAGALIQRAYDVLPYTLTGAQTAAVGDIYADMAADTRMFRLLQGDVGSGKTVVAFFAMLRAIANGTQAALMAPTEILARQHESTIRTLADKLDLNVVTLTGRDKGKGRNALLDDIANGRADIVIGTHALFQKDVQFKDLGLVVIDEQHRFGVHQRMELSEKGAMPDVLVMTATPIPRTLTMTIYGDMDVSRLHEKPPGRQPIDTRIASIERMQEVIDGIRRKTEAGEKAYWVCPLVEESEKLDLAAATERYDHLRVIFGERVGLLHGRMKPAEKDAVMDAFKTGGLDVLVSTTVIEVGVDVPSATVMVIEHAERFGLSQLHQLRGRIGRGSGKSTCILLYNPKTNEVAKQRLQVIRGTEDGFVIAEEDLKLRGAGEVLGAKQSGLPVFRFAELSVHSDLVKIARDDARLLIERDPALAAERGRAIISLLYLMGKDDAADYLSG